MTELEIVTISSKQTTNKNLVDSTKVKESKSSRFGHVLYSCHCFRLIERSCKSAPNVPKLKYFLTFGP